MNPQSGFKNAITSRVFSTLQVFGSTSRISRLLVFPSVLEQSENAVWGD